MTVDGQDIDHESGGDGFSGDPALTGFLGHFEAHHGPWSFALAPMIVNLEFTGDQSGGIDAVVKIHAQVHEAFVAREIGGSWEGLAGAPTARHARRPLDRRRAHRFARRRPPGSIRSSARASTTISAALVVARADVGGFGVGSDFAWNASALVGYRFPVPGGRPSSDTTSSTSISEGAPATIAWRHDAAGADRRLVLSF